MTSVFSGYMGHNIRKMRGKKNGTTLHWGNNPNNPHDLISLN